MYLASDVRHAVTRLHEAFTILQKMHALGLAPLDEVSVSAFDVVFICFTLLAFNLSHECFYCRVSWPCYQVVISGIEKVIVGKLAWLADLFTRMVWVHRIPKVKVKVKVNMDLCSALL